MQHSGQGRIVNEAGMGENLVGNIQPLHGVSGKAAARRCFGHRARGGMTVERNFAREFPVAGADIAGPGNGAIDDIERIGSDTEAVGRGNQENLPDFGADLPDRAPRLLHGKTAGSDTFIGTARRRCANHLHAGDIDIKLVGGDLGQRRHDALPDLDLARRDRHLSLRRDADPR